MRIPLASSRNDRSRWIPVPCMPVFLAVALLALSPILSAEDGKTLKVCIPQPTASDASLHQVASDLSHHKPDAATRIRLEGVQLANIDQILVTDNLFKGNLAKQTLSDEVRDRAMQVQCDYILVVAIPDVSTARSPQPNVMSPNRQATTSTPAPYMRRQDPDYYVQVKYRLYAKDPATPPVDGFVTTHDSAPQQTVVQQALAMLANQVFTKLTK